MIKHSTKGKCFIKCSDNCSHNKTMNKFDFIVEIQGNNGKSFFIKNKTEVLEFINQDVIYNDAFDFINEHTEHRCNEMGHLRFKCGCTSHIKENSAIFKIYSEGKAWRV